MMRVKMCMFLPLIVWHCSQPLPPDAPAQAARPAVVSDDLVVATVVSVYDGDTFMVNLAIGGCPAVFCERIGVRIRGIDTPEMDDARPELALIARDARTELLRLVQCGGEVILKNARRDKYFRILADVFACGKSVMIELITLGLARVYPGEGPKPW